MNIKSTLLIIITSSMFASCGRSDDGAQSFNRTRKFNDEWVFINQDVENGWRPAYDDSEWQPVDLPHDWSITEPYHPDNPGGHGTSYMIGGVGWYRKTFELPYDYANKRVEITFDGVYQNSTVWINGHELVTRPFGYISFRYDLTPYLNQDVENVITVRVDNSKQPNSRWYSGSGIYRNVWLTVTGKQYLDPWDLFIHTPKVNEQTATVSFEGELANDDTEAVNVNLVTRVFDPAGLEIRKSESTVLIPLLSKASFQQEFEVAEPNLWSVNDPALYKVKFTLLDGKRVVDELETTFGIRHFHFDADAGFFLNEKPLKIKGVCMHHDLGALGAAVNTRAIERQLEILRDMGVNAIRTAHNPPAPELLHLCDKMGFLVMNETFDEWAMGKTKHGYAEIWEQWHEQDLQDHIRRDRNHPSVIIWSIGNEILEQWHPQGTEMTQKLVAIVKNLDPTRPITAGNNDPVPANTLIRSGLLDLIGYNYKHHTFKNFPTAFPTKAFIATETTSALATRGSYDLPSDSMRIWPVRWDVKFEDGNPDNTCSAYDNCHTPWGSSHQASWLPVKEHDFLSGLFIWTGFDYLGEPTPYQWPSRSSYFGIVDLAGFPKDAYYMYKSEWTEDTVLHVFPHWNWQPGQMVDVWAYFNHADEVELFVNDVSKGIRKREDQNLHAMWRLPFEPGTVKAVSRNEGTLVKEVLSITAGKPARIMATADREILSKGGDDLSFITIDITDENGVLVPDASNSVSIAISGDASVAGVDNGDPTSHHNFQATAITAFHGKCLAIVRAGKTKGKVYITFKSEGLFSTTVALDIF